MTLTLGTKMVSLQEMFEPNCWVWEHPLLAARALKIANLKASDAQGVRDAIATLNAAAAVTGVRLRDPNRKLQTSPDRNCLVELESGARMMGCIEGKRVVFVDPGKRPFSCELTVKGNRWNVRNVYTGRADAIRRAEFYRESIADLKQVWP